MSEARPTIEELEKKLAGIKNTKARVDILSSLVYSYSNDISSMFSTKIEEAKKGTVFKNKDQKKDVEEIIKAISKVVGDRYHLRYDVVCKIASGNDLEFKLDFNTGIVPAVVSAKKIVDSLSSQKESHEKRLAKWKRDMLYRIANGDDFTDFKLAGDKP